MKCSSSLAAAVRERGGLAECFEVRRVAFAENFASKRVVKRAVGREADES
jgi:hypothetical protein